MRTASSSTNTQYLIGPSRQRGTILVSILLLVAVAAYIATEMTYRQTMDIRRTGNIIALDQAYEYLLAAEETAKLGLKLDLRNDRQINKPMDTVYPKVDKWSEPQQFPIPGGYIAGEVTELNGRYNLNWLLQTNDDIRKARKAEFEQLLTKLQLPTEGTVTEISERIIDWIDANNDAEGFDGREEDFYLASKPAYRTGNRLLLETSELLMVEGITLEDLEILEPYISMLPPDTPLNINTAPQEVLESFLCLNSAQIISQREANQGIGKTDEITLKTADSSCENVNLDTSRFDTKSEYFLLDAEVTQGDQLMRMRSILYRSSNQQGDEAKIQVIYRKQLDPFSRV